MIADTESLRKLKGEEIKLKGKAFFFLLSFHLWKINEVEFINVNIFMGIL